jgi:hypothetical protein
MPTGLPGALFASGLPSLYAERHLSTPGHTTMQDRRAPADAAPPGKDVRERHSPFSRQEIRRRRRAQKQRANGSKPPAKQKRRWFRRGVLPALAVLALALVAGRLYLPTFLRDYVNDTLDRNPLYDGEIGDIEVHLWRGAYAINDVRIVKTTGNVPVPLFAARKVDLAMEWGALLKKRALVGRVSMTEPQLNFVDDTKTDSGDQTGGGGPWLAVIRDLFPFKINSSQLSDGRVSFRAFDTDPPVDMFVSDVDAEMTNLSNLTDELNPLNATVSVRGKVLDHAPLELEMKLDPASYRPTFQVALRLLGLDVTRTNPLTRAYGQFDFEKGWFDLVVEMDAREGGLEGYVKPLFRNLVVLAGPDVKEDNVIQLFWEALVGLTAEVLQNQPREQFGTVIPFTGDLTNPRTDLLATLGNVLRNAFIRAYLPKLQGQAVDVDNLRFSPGAASDPVTSSP